MQNKALKNIKKYYVIFILIIIFMLILINSIYGDKEESMQNILLKINKKEYEAVFYDNSTARELIKKFPMTIIMSDLHGNEKYYNLPSSFPTSSERISNITKGDIMLFGDDCLVIFYKSFSTHYRYTKLGYIKNAEDLDNSLGRGDIGITFEKK